MGVSKTTVQHLIVASTIHVHSNLLKPILTEENILARLLMANHFRDPQDPSNYQDMCDHIHLDEVLPYPGEGAVPPSPRQEEP